MKANEIIIESTSELTEAPVGGLSRLFTNIGAKLGLSGSQIQKEVNDEMMQVKKEINPILKSRGGKISTEEMLTFLRGKGYGYNSEKIIKDIKKQNRSKSSAPLTSKEVDRIIERSVVTGYADKGGTGTGRYGTKVKKGAQFVRNPKTAKSDDNTVNRNFSQNFGRDRRVGDTKQEEIRSFVNFFKTLSPAERKMFSDMLKEK